jgi:translation initiation factor RLI1
VKISGAKGIGKTTVLNILYKRMCEKYEEDGESNPECHPICRAKGGDARYEDIYTAGFDANTKNTIFFIDDLRSPTDDNGRSRLKQLLKEVSTNNEKQLNKIIATTSRNGLSHLKEQNVISIDDGILIVCVKPEEKVAEELFDKEADKYEGWNEDFKKEVISTVGYVPGAVKRFFSMANCVSLNCDSLNCDSPNFPTDKASWEELFRQYKEVELETKLQLIKDDFKYFTQIQYEQQFLKLLIILTKEEEVKISHYGFNAFSLPWTLLVADKRLFLMT